MYYRIIPFDNGREVQSLRATYSNKAAAIARIEHIWAVQDGPETTVSRIVLINCETGYIARNVQRPL